MTDAVLSVRDLDVTYATRNGLRPAVRGVSFDLWPGEFLGVVGESGCGKSTIANAALRLLPDTSRVAGQIIFRGTDLLQLGPELMRQVRGRSIGLVPQDPLISLDPTFSVGSQIAEAVRAHQRVSRGAAKRAAIDLMDRVGITDPARRYRQPPRAFSGGMRQRVAIAIAIANSPSVIVADEPTTALDVTIQAQVLRQLTGLAREMGTAVLFISHNLPVVTQICDRVLVLYAGAVVEVGPTAQVIGGPRHPYTRALLESVPSAAAARGELRTIPGEVSTDSATTGCRFAPRCRYRMDRCAQEPPLIGDVDWRSACWLHEPGEK